ncbi:MAG: hypothetical protein FJ086_15725 [Deltaproteobacteria bacterium]|nr:hypothetical protein [Deltaproteobacteria bacterium]
MNPTADRRQHRRLPLTQARRRYLRTSLDVDWFVDVGGLTTMGRGIELTPRSAVVPGLLHNVPLGAQVVLHVALPARARLFRARGHVMRRMGRGLLIRFEEVLQEDLVLLGEALVAEQGPGALPSLERKFRRLTELHPRHFRGH